MSAISIKHEKNYAAQIVRLPEPVKAQNSDRLYVVNVLGYSIIVDESWKDRAGDLAVFFPAESQISQELAWFANLNSKAELNSNPEEKGYLGKNRRVRAIKLRGNVSSALLLPLHVIGLFSGAPVGEFPEGETFDTVNGLEICRKYELPQKTENPSAGQKKIKAAFKRVDEKVFPMHIDTDQWLRNEQNFHDDDVLIVTQKLHGSSVRFGNVPVRVKLTWLEKLAATFGVRVQSHEFDKVGGSRKVIKDPNNPDQKHFYGEGNDIWTETLNAYGDTIPEGVIVYGELVGWTRIGAPIQKGFTYDALNGFMNLYVYRVAIVTEEGGLYDLSWDQVRTFCQRHNMRYTPELWRGFKKDFNVSFFDEKNFYREWADSHQPAVDYADPPVRLSDGGTGRDEGIVIRIDRGETVPSLLKYKFASFLTHETEDLDAQEESGEVGIEA